MTKWDLPEKNKYYVTNQLMIEIQLKNKWP